nr:uncharacterized protein LOC123753723 [Procambarus clarkii]
MHDTDLSTTPALRSHRSPLQHLWSPDTLCGCVSRWRFSMAPTAAPDSLCGVACVLDQVQVQKFKKIQMFIQMWHVTSLVFLTVLTMSWAAADVDEDDDFLGDFEPRRSGDYRTQSNPLRGLDWVRKGYGYHTRKFRSPHRRVNKIRNGRDV